jgi:hypothetical protein
MPSLAREGNSRKYRRYVQTLQYYLSLERRVLPVESSEHAARRIRYQEVSV